MTILKLPKAWLPRVPSKLLQAENLQLGSEVTCQNPQSLIEETTCRRRSIDI